MKENEMGGAWSMNVRGEICIPKIFYENMKGRCNPEDIDVNWMITLKLIKKKCNVKLWAEFIWFS
jgi:hypothetical protein